MRKSDELPLLAQVISLVGWPKLVKLFFFFLLLETHIACDRLYLTAMTEACSLHVRGLVVDVGCGRVW